MVRASGRHVLVAVALSAGLTLSALGVATAEGSTGHQHRAGADAGQPVSFTGANTGLIPDGSLQCNNGVAGVRDVSFPVSGVPGPLTDVALTVTLTHTWSGDVSLVLIAPNGTQAPVMVIPGASAAAQCGYSSDFGGAYTFNDQAAANIWDGLESLSSTGVLATGSFRASGPLVRTPVSLTAAFASLANPNGGWILRVSDTSHFDTGTISAATLTLTGTSVSCQQANQAAQAALAAATKALGTKKAKLKKAKKNGDAAKVKKAKKAVKKAKAAVKTAQAAVTAAQAAGC